MINWWFRVAKAYKEEPIKLAVDAQAKANCQSGDWS